MRNLDFSRRPLASFVRTENSRPHRDSRAISHFRDTIAIRPVYSSRFPLYVRTAFTRSTAISNIRHLSLARGALPSLPFLPSSSFVSRFRANVCTYLSGSPDSTLEYVEYERHARANLYVESKHFWHCLLLVAC